LIELDSDLIELNLNSTKFYSKIEFKKDEMQIGGEGIENLLMNMVLGKK
jgi:hypothetical protein